LLPKEPQQLATRQPPLDDYRPAGINAVYLKNRLPQSNPIVTAVSMALLLLASLQ
jgi:hypothetical protein